MFNSNLNVQGPIPVALFFSLIAFFVFTGKCQWTLRTVVVVVRAIPFTSDGNNPPDITDQDKRKGVATLSNCFFFPT